MRQDRFLTIAFLTMLVAIPLKAQWEVGGLIDFNFASLNVNPGSSSEDYSSRFGFGLGVVVDYPLTGQLDLHAEPMFLQKGGKIDITSEVVVFKLNYLEIPLMLRYTFEYDASFLPYAMAGPSIGLLTSAKYDNNEGTVQDEKDSTKGIDLGVGFGGGVKLPHGNKTFFAELRYVFGLVDINKEANESTVKNRGLQVVAGVTFPVGQN